MILLRTGSVGEGKSYCTISECVDHIRSGGVVATNFGLADKWAERATRSRITDFFFPEEKHERVLCNWNRWFKIGTVESINELSKRLPDLVQGDQKKRLKAHRRSGRSGIPESLGLLVLDEGHIFFNSRDWRNNLPMIHFLSQSRKKGWDVVIIAHHEDMIDSQIRSGLINQLESMRNLSNVCPIPFVPFKIKYLTGGKPIFLGIRKLSGGGGGKGMIVSRPVKVLDDSVSSLYETMEEFNYLDQVDAPERIGAPPAPQSGGATPPDNPQLRQALRDALAGLTEHSEGTVTNRL